MKRIILLSLHLLIFFNIIFCQDVVEQIKKYNITTLEKKAINKTRKQLKIEKDKNLHVITIFTVKRKENFTGNKLTYLQLIENIELWDDEEIYFFVYDDSLNVISETSNKASRIIPVYFPEKSKEYLFVRYYLEKKPDYFFGYLSSEIPNLPGFCYFSFKDNEAELVYLEFNADKLTIVPISELNENDIEALNPPPYVR